MVQGPGDFDYVEFGASEKQHRSFVRRLFPILLEDHMMYLCDSDEPEWEDLINSEFALLLG